MGREGVRTHPCGMDVLRVCIFPSCRVVSRRVVSRRVVSRCVVSCRVALCRVVSRCVASRRVALRRVALRRVALRRVRRCSLWEPPAAKHGSTSLRLSGRAGGFRWVFFSVLFCPVALRCVLSCRVALRCVLSRRVVSAGVPFGSHLRLSMVQPL